MVPSGSCKMRGRSVPRRRTRENGSLPALVHLSSHFQPLLSWDGGITVDPADCMGLYTAAKYKEL